MRDDAPAVGQFRRRSVHNHLIAVEASEYLDAFGAFMTCLQQSQTCDAVFNDKHRRQLPLAPDRGRGRR